MTRDSRYGNCFFVPFRKSFHPIAFLSYNGIMRLPSDKLYIPRISIREGVVRNTFTHKRRRKRFARLGRIKMIVAASFIFAFLWLGVELANSGLDFLSKDKPQPLEEIPLLLPTPQPEPAPPGLDSSTMSISRRNLAPPQPMPTVLPEISSPSPSATVKKGREHDSPHDPLQHEKRPGDVEEDQQSSTIHD